MLYHIGEIFFPIPTQNNRRLNAALIPLINNEFNAGQRLQFTHPLVVKGTAPVNNHGLFIIETVRVFVVQHIKTAGERSQEIISNFICQLFFTNAIENLDCQGFGDQGFGGRGFGGRGFGGRGFGGRGFGYQGSRRVGRRPFFLGTFGILFKCKKDRGDRYSDDCQDQKYNYDFN
ncbi:MAG: hypothetical protein B6244_05095 [Candidatus Cloacimonetes bacterium 4572_55]|nr:MAG: hypothetical protein B6244_05095 [Candidatus Cloacimonetes bacterium 4572_55]